MSGRRVFDQLLSCARDNNVQGITELLRMGCPPTYSNSVGQSGLHIGAMWGCIEAVKVLLEAQANPNHQNHLRGSAPLHAVALGRGPAEKRAECAKLIQEYKGDPRMPDNGGGRPLDFAEDEVVRIALGAAPMLLHNAVKARKLQALEDALQQTRMGNVPNLTLDSSSADGNTALHLAVAIGWLEAVHLLLEVRADPSTQNAEQRAPVHTAVLAGNHVILKALLDAKAYVSATDRDQDADPRFSSTSFEEVPDEHRTALHYAANLCNVVAMKALLEAKSNVNAKDSKAQSPLHLCLDLRTNPEIDAGCGVRVTGLKNKPDWNDCLGSAMGPAIAVDGDESNVRCPVLLLNPGAQNALLKPDNLELLQDEALELLLDAKADVNAGSHIIGESRTVLHVASRIGDASLAQKVIAARANLEQVDSKQGFSALHLATRGKHVDVVRILVEAKAQLGLRTYNGQTAADLATTNGACTEIHELLSGASPTAPSPTMPTTYESLTKEQKAALFIE